MGGGREERKLPNNRGEEVKLPYFPKKFGLRGKIESVRDNLGEITLKHCYYVGVGYNQVREM